MARTCSSLGALSLILAVHGPALAQDADLLRLSGTTRWRGESVTGQVRPGFARSENLLAIRTTLRADIGSGPLTATVELWDSRAYGVDAGSVLSTTDVNTLEPVQAHVRYAPATGPRLTVGRMLLNLGSRRLVAADDFRNTTNGYTGVMVELGRRDAVQALAIAMLPQQRLPEDFDDLKDNVPRLDREDFSLVLLGGQVWAPRALGATMVEGSVFALLEDDRVDRPTRNRQLLTFGARLHRPPAPGKADHEVEFFWQTGTTRLGLGATAPEADVAAWFLHADAGVTLAGSWRPRLSIAFDHASGDDRGPTYRRFDTLFGLRRAELAPSGLYNVIGRANISSPGLRVEVSPSRTIDAHASWRLLWAASGTDSFSTTGVRDPSGRSGQFAGHQFEGRLRGWVIRDRLRAEANWAMLFREGLLLNAPNAPPGTVMAYVTAGLQASF